MIIGREQELSVFQNAIQDDSSHFIAVYGRRRIGKTYLIREAFNYRFTFQHAGVYNGSLKEQLFAFEASLKDAGQNTKVRARNWLEAFEELKDLIRASSEKKKVLFIDELSWMDTPRSDLMTALENFWNGWASARKDIVLIVCASATSWMLSKVIHNKGGLYNRLTEKIHLRPFSLAECEKYVAAKNYALTRDQILQYYMVFGGVPFYWSFLKKGLSLPQNIDCILFEEDAPLKNEFDYLYAAIFKNPKIHLKIIQALGRRKAGMTRNEIISSAAIPNSGDLTKKLKELESCGFIRSYQMFGKEKKDTVYQLMDNFTLFYYQFMERAPTDPHFWSNQINTPAVNSWMGLAFERVCLEHVDQIKMKLGISGVLTESQSWQCRKDPEKGIHGSQIDLLIVRKDQVINLCEMKYSQTEYAVTGKDRDGILHKMQDLVTSTGTKYAIHPTLITCIGTVSNSNTDIIQSVVTADDLFKE